jgi:hypothetical protein
MGKATQARMLVLDDIAFELHEHDPDEQIRG